MSFYCGNCGKNCVSKPGDWCDECQRRAFLDELAWEEEWYSESRLCQHCAFAWGPDPNDKCGAYNMPLYMVKRKYKCKYFKECEPCLEENLVDPNPFDDGLWR